MSARLETELSAVRKRLDQIQSALTRSPVFTPGVSSGPLENFGDNPSSRIPVMVLSDTGFMEVIGLRKNVADELIFRERAHKVPSNQYGRGRTLVIQQHDVLA